MSAAVIAFALPVARFPMGRLSVGLGPGVVARWVELPPAWFGVGGAVIVPMDVEDALAGRLTRRPFEDLPGILLVLGNPRPVAPMAFSSNPLFQALTGGCFSRSSPATFSALLLEGIKFLPNSLAPLAMLVRLFDRDGNLEWLLDGDFCVAACCWHANMICPTT